MYKSGYVWAFLRIGLGGIFLWTFLDKTFGLGYSTAPDGSWLMGTSPTLGYLKSATYGPFENIFAPMAGNPIVDWLFMLGMLLSGLALIFGIFIKIAGYVGTLMMFLIYLSAFPPKQNPLIDQHIIYILILFGLVFEDSDQRLGLGKRWKETSLVKKYPFLR